MHLEERIHGLEQPWTDESNEDGGGYQAKHEHGGEDENERPVGGVMRLL
jgi:hypothetical protein